MLFQYTVLGKNTVRLIRFLPYSTPGNIFLSLEHQTLPPPKNATFTFLSYLRGATTDRKPVTLSGRAFMVPTNVWQALSDILEFHSKWKDGRFFVDVICVNQRDAEERSAMAGQMGRVVEGAERVFGWLGEGEGFDGDVEKAVGRSRYWGGAWSRMEFLAAKEVSLICGRQEWSFETLRLHIAADQAETDASVRKLIETKAKLTEPTRDPSMDSIIELLEEYASKFTSDLRDRIFAFFNDPRMRQFGRFPSPRFEYSSTLEQIHQSLLQWFDVLVKEESSGKVNAQRAIFDEQVCKALGLARGENDSYRSTM